MPVTDRQLREEKYNLENRGNLPDEISVKQIDNGYIVRYRCKVFVSKELTAILNAMRLFFAGKIAEACMELGVKIVNDKAPELMPSTRPNEVEKETEPLVDRELAGTASY